MRARRAVRRCCLKKKEACFLRSFKPVPMGMEIDMSLASLLFFSVLVLRCSSN